MYTQCAKCETVFRLAAETLRAAGGQVRCGRCGVVFNALSRLAEDPSAFPPSESALEMETRADEILRAAPVRDLPAEAEADPADVMDFETDGSDFARLQVIERFVEDHAPPELAAARPPQPPPPAAAPPSAPPPAGPVVPRAAVAAKPPAPQPLPVKPLVKTAADSALDDEPMASMEFTLPPGELDRVFVERTGARLQMPAVQPATAAAGVSLPRVGTDLEIPEDIRRDMLSGMGRPESDPATSVPDLEAPRRFSGFNRWLAAALFLALLLCLQVARDHREWLAAHAPWRGSLQGLYAALGVSGTAAPDLSAYQLRQWGVTGSPGASGTLRVRASILNAAPQLQPYPLLRVTLANRFGARIGTRDFEPAEYMGKPIARMLAPGERADAVLDVVDPGKDAEGFEIDVCLRGVDRKISCAGDAPARAPGVS